MKIPTPRFDFGNAVFGNGVFANAVVVLTLVQLIWPTSPAVGAEGRPPPDPRALLQGVEASRGAIRGGHFEYEIRVKGADAPFRDGATKSLVVDFKGPRWRVVRRERQVVSDNAENSRRLAAMNYDREAFVRAGLGRWAELTDKQVFDGTTLLTSSAPMSAGLSDPQARDNQRLSATFDPRTFGLTLSGAPDETLRNCLFFDGPHTLVCLGQETVGEQKAWHVVLTIRPDRDSVERHFWIGDVEGFPVYRLAVKVGGQVRQLLECTYKDPVKDRPLPCRVVHRVRPAEDGSARFESTTQELVGHYDAEPADETFTLAGLELEIGANVADNRLRRVVGYWNGTGLSDNPLQAKRLANAGPDQRLGLRRGVEWSVITLVGLALIVLAYKLWRRRATLAT